MNENKKNLDKIYLNLRKSRIMKDNNFKWLGCYKCNRLRKTCIGYITKDDLENNNKVYK